MSMDGGESGNNVSLGRINFIGMKMFITSTERFGFKSASGTWYASYSGIEI